MPSYGTMSKRKNTSKQSAIVDKNVPIPVNSGYIIRPERKKGTDQIELTDEAWKRVKMLALHLRKIHIKLRKQGRIPPHKPIVYEETQDE